MMTQLCRCGQKLGKWVYQVLVSQQSCHIFTIHRDDQRLCRTKEVKGGEGGRWEEDKENWAKREEEKKGEPLGIA